MVIYDNNTTTGTILFDNRAVGSSNGEPPGFTTSSTILGPDNPIGDCNFVFGMMDFCSTGNCLTFQFWATSVVNRAGWDCLVTSVVNQCVIPTLPVELLGFNYECLGDGLVKFKWSTASEINNDYFTIEKSNNGKDFMFVSEINGKGNINEVVNYQYFDKYEQKCYYRLKQTDFDGKTKYSEILSVTCKDNNVSAYAFVDAGTGNIVLKTFGIVEDDCIVYMIDYTGRTVIQKSLSLKNIENNIIFTNKGISAGLYNIVLQTSNDIITKQIVIPK